MLDNNDDMFSLLSDAMAKSAKEDPSVERDFLNVPISDKPIRPKGGYTYVYEHGDNDRGKKMCSNQN